MAIRARPRTGAANPNPNVSELSASRASVVVTPAWDGWPDAKTTAAPRPTGNHRTGRGTPTAYATRHTEHSSIGPTSAAMLPSRTPEPGSSVNGNQVAADRAPNPSTPAACSAPQTVATSSAATAPTIPVSRPARGRPDPRNRTETPTAVPVSAVHAATPGPMSRHPMNGITGSGLPASRNPYRARPVSTVAATGRRGADQPAPTRPSRAMAATATARAPSSTGVRAGTGTDRDTRWTRLNRAPAASVTPAGARSGRPAVIARSRQVRGAAPAGSTGGDRARLAANATDRAARTSRVSERSARSADSSACHSRTSSTDTSSGHRRAARARQASVNRSTTVMPG